MNYKVLYRKYRPDNFDSLIGQNHVVNILKNSIKDNKIAHAYLFSGPRGTGKTSTARILAKSVNCLNNNEGLACESCENCQSFNSNPDIIEIDAASNNGVDEIRELINNVKIMPTSLKYKVYIIDEVHMLSQSAFNALLLTLEEPPEHVIFILATTNLESVPITIVSRCQKFDFQKIDNDSILSRLIYVCKEENIKYDEEGLKEIALLSDGGLRDALSILDQLSKNEEKITVDLVNKEIGSISSKKIYELIESIDKSDVNNIDKIINELQKSGINYKLVIKKIIKTISEIAVEILNSNKNWNFSFDDCKKLILELNDLMNKISINVDSYLIIKMILLSYCKNLSNNEIKSVSEKETNKVSEKEKEIKQEPPINNKVNKKVDHKSDDFCDIRINNCFVGAAKNYLSEIKQHWEDFINNCDIASIKGLVSDTIIVASSDKYAIIVSQISHKDDEINNNINKIEDCFNKFINKDLKLVCISNKKWDTEKKKYIDNIKNNNQYEYIEEKINMSSNSNDIEDVSSVFDINKIEVE